MINSHTCKDRLYIETEPWNTSQEICTRLCHDFFVAVVSPGTPSQYKYRYGIPVLKIRRSWDRLIFNMGIPILVRRYLYIESGPSCLWIPVEGLPIIFNAAPLPLDQSYNCHVTSEVTQRDIGKLVCSGKELAVCIIRISVSHCSAWASDCLVDSLVGLPTKKTSKLRTNGPLCGESTGDRGPHKGW